MRGGARRKSGGRGRAARYAAFAERLGPGEVLLTAHHADDQLEIDPAAVVARRRTARRRRHARRAEFRPGWHARPLLGLPAAELAAWARGGRLRGSTDPSNLDPRFDRNYLRLEVLPAIRRAGPQRRGPPGALPHTPPSCWRMEAEIARRTVATSPMDVRCRSSGCGIAGGAPEGVLRAGSGGGLPAPAAPTLAAAMRDMAVAAGDRVPCASGRGPPASLPGRLYAEAGLLKAAVPDGEWAPGSVFRLDGSGHWNSCRHGQRAQPRPAAGRRGRRCARGRRGIQPAGAGTAGRCASGFRTEACCRGAAGRFRSCAGAGNHGGRRHRLRGGFAARAGRTLVARLWHGRPLLTEGRPKSIALTSNWPERRRWPVPVARRGCSIDCSPVVLLLRRWPQ